MAGGKSMLSLGNFTKTGVNNSLYHSIVVQIYWRSEITGHLAISGQMKFRGFSSKSRLACDRARMAQLA
jgi:hypothetical protein